MKIAAIVLVLASLGSSATAQTLSVKSEFRVMQMWTTDPAQAWQLAACDNYFWARTEGGRFLVSARFMPKLDGATAVASGIVMPPGSMEVEFDEEELSPAIHIPGDGSKGIIRLNHASFLRMRTCLQSFPLKK